MFLLIHSFHCTNEVQNEIIFEELWVLCMITENRAFLLILSKTGPELDLAGSALGAEPLPGRVFHTGGQIAGSLAVLSDAAHLLVDLTSFLISLFSLWLTSKPPTKQFTFGWHRAGTKPVIL